MNGGKGVEVSQTLSWFLTNFQQTVIEVACIYQPDGL